MVFVFYIPLAIRLTEDEYNTLTTSRNDKQRNGLTHNKGITASGAAFVALLLSRAFPIEDYLYFNSHLLNIGLTLFVFGIVMGIRVWMSRRKIVSMLENNDHLIKVYCVPTTLKFIFFIASNANDFSYHCWCGLLCGNN